MEATFDFAVYPRDEASVYEALWEVEQAPSVMKISSIIGAGDSTDVLTRADAHIDLFEKSELGIEIDNIRLKLVDNYLNEVGKLTYR